MGAFSQDSDKAVVADRSFPLALRLFRSLGVAMVECPTMRDLRLFYSSVFAISTAAFAAGCHSDRNKAIAPPDSYLLFVPSAPNADSPGVGAPLHVEKADFKTPAVQPIPRLFETGFASEMLRTVYLAGQYLRDATVDGRRFSDVARANGSFPVCLVVGVERATYARGLSIKGGFSGSSDRPDLPWIGIPAEPERDKALLQTLTGRLADYAAELVATGGLLDAAPAPPKSLVDGYRMAMEVVAREWRTTEGPDGVIQVEEGTTQQREVFGNIRENRYVIADGSTALRPAREMLDSPGVAGTVLYRMAQSRAVGPRVAPEAFYAPYAAKRMPPGVSPAAILGTFRNFQAKLLGVWASAVLRGKAPKDIIDLIELYGAEFPAERSEVIRIFVVTTFGGTIKPGGCSMQPQDARQTLAELTTMAAEVGARRKTLRDALGPTGK